MYRIVATIPRPGNQAQIDLKIELLQQLKTIQGDTNITDFDIELSITGLMLTFHRDFNTDKDDLRNIQVLTGENPKRCAVINLITELEAKNLAALQLVIDALDAPSCKALGYFGDELDDMEPSDLFGAVESLKLINHEGSLLSYAQALVIQLGISVVKLDGGWWAGKGQPAAGVSGWEASHYGTAVLAFVLDRHLNPEKYQ